MRTTISLPDPLYANARLYAREHGVSFSDLVEDALRSHMAAKPTQAVREFRLHTVRGRLVNPDLDLNRTSALEIENDEREFSRGGR